MPGNGKSGSVTNKDLYDSLNNVRLELKTDIKDLRSQFELLEAGRLTRAEGNIQDLRNDLQKAINNINLSIGQVRTAGGVLSAKAAVIGSIIVILVTAFASALFFKLIVQP